ncbi:hypothetical protein MPER_10898 [Moniliophthora perniciosa FA553]|nr:hypothetical protein MPER_10898 [Moniliophthora perniciosa FA553]
MTRRQRRKHERSRYKLGIEVEVFVAEKGFKDLTKDARWSEKQWMGQNAPIDHRLALQADLDSGVPLEGFIRLDYLYKATKIADAKRRVVIFRSYVTKRMQDHILSKVIPEVERFIKDTSDPSLSDRRKNLRGLHWFCIAGGDRNLKRKPALTPWHRKHAEVIRQYFQKDRVFYKLTEYGCALRKWSRIMLEALFGGIFFNFCINGTKFTGARKEVKFVVTEDGQRPTPSNSTPLNNNATSSASSEGEDSELEGLDPPRCSCGNSEDHGDKWEKAQGRGSIVWFNQASLFQTSELGYDTIEEAEAHGKDTHCNKSPDDMFETPW